MNAACAADFQAYRLDRAVERRFPVDFRTAAQIQADRRLNALLDEHGGALINLIESKMLPVMKRLRALNAGAYMSKTVLGTSDEISLEVGLGCLWSYRFTVTGFCYRRLIGICDLMYTERKDDYGLAYAYHTTTIGGLAELPEGPTWLLIPEERWHQAGIRPDMVDFTGLPPLEDHLQLVLDQVVERFIQDVTVFRRKYGFPVHPSEVAGFRLRRLMEQLYGGA